jgi:hypothetical protein
MPAAVTASATPRNERRLGADHDESGSDLAGQRGHGSAVHRVDVVQRGDLGDAGVARGRVHLADTRVAGQGEGQRVLAPAGADHEGSHRGRAYRADHRSHWPPFHHVKQVNLHFTW